MRALFLFTSAWFVSLVALVVANPTWFRYGVAAMVLGWGIGAFLSQIVPRGFAGANESRD